MNRRYAWLPDLPDARDRPYMVRRNLANLPAHVDLRPSCSPIDDQTTLGACTGHAIAGMLEYYAVKAGKPVDYSRLFIYYQERLLEHTVRSDAGAMIRDGMKACAKVGAPLETLWPYDVKKFARKPPAKAYADAAARKIKSYRRVADLDHMRAELALGNPVVLGITVYESFESDQVARTGVVPMPGAHERSLGGHAVLAVGYDDATQMGIVRNSWGPEWGDGGYFYLPYAYVRDRDLSDDFWVATP
jgi:C1A family cysteine protease